MESVRHAWGWGLLRIESEVFGRYVSSNVKSNPSVQFVEANIQKNRRKNSTPFDYPSTKHPIPYVRMARNSTLGQVTLRFFAEVECESGSPLLRFADCADMTATCCAAEQKTKPVCTLW